MWAPLSGLLWTEPGPALILRRGKWRKKVVARRVVWTVLRAELNIPFSSSSKLLVQYNFLVMAVQFSVGCQYQPAVVTVFLVRNLQPVIELDHSTSQWTVDTPTSWEMYRQYRLLPSSFTVWLPASRLSDHRIYFNITNLVNIPPPQVIRPSLLSNHLTGHCSRNWFYCIILTLNMTSLNLPWCCLVSFPLWGNTKVNWFEGGNPPQT